VTEIEARLREHGGCLMPTAMHPWMDPSSQTRLWPHEYQTVYRAFDRIFDCAGHGWSNVQSTHINLPYQGDDELRRLHGAIRLVLPILPAIAASSPIVDGRATGWLDTRIEHYRRNCQRIPSVTGHIVPEVARSEAEYRERILDRIAGDIGPLDPDHYLDPEWVNARGAIVRFVRDSIEIRVIDVQEQPRADLAIAALTVGVLRELIAERFSSLEAQEQLAEAALETTLLGCAREGEQHLVTDARYLRCLGLDGSPCSAAEVWRRLRGVVGIAADWDEPLDVLLEHGSLARRVLGALERTPDGLHAIYRELCACLADGRMFMP
jgi:gamma-glutamyl:cysteine ligase YbdK (ATP-grasp superfamily)